MTEISGTDMVDEDWSFHRAVSFRLMLHVLFGRWKPRKAFQRHHVVTQ